MPIIGAGFDGHGGISDRARTLIDGAIGDSQPKQAPIISGEIKLDIGRDAFRFLGNEALYHRGEQRLNLLAASHKDLLEIALSHKKCRLAICGNRYLAVGAAPQR
jgi:hypothetical protein